MSWIISLRTEIDNLFKFVSALAKKQQITIFPGKNLRQIAIAWNLIFAKSFFFASHFKKILETWKVMYDKNYEKIKQGIATQAKWKQVIFRIVFVLSKMCFVFPMLLELPYWQTELLSPLLLRKLISEHN